MITAHYLCGAEPKTDIEAINILKELGTAYE